MQHHSLARSSCTILATCHMTWVQQSTASFAFQKQGHCSTLPEQAVYEQLLQLQCNACAEQLFCNRAAAVEASHPLAGLLGAGH